MSNYIVDPMFFYWCDVANGALEFVVYGFTLMLIVTIGFVLFNFSNNYKYDSVFEIPKFKKKLTVLIIITALFGLGLVFFPSKETLIEMEIARHATYENLDIVIQKIADVAKEIVGNGGA